MIAAFYAENQIPGESFELWISLVQDAASFIAAAMSKGPLATRKSLLCRRTQDIQLVASQAAKRGVLLKYPVMDAIQLPPESWGNPL